MARPKTDRSAEEAATALVADLVARLVPLVRDEVVATWDDPDRLLGLQEVATRCGVSLRTVKTWIGGEAPVLVSVKVGRDRKVRQGDVATLLAKGWQ